MKGVYMSAIFPREKITFPREKVVAKALEFLSYDIFQNAGEITLAKDKASDSLKALQNCITDCYLVSEIIVQLGILISHMKTREAYGDYIVPVGNINHALANSVPTDDFPPGC